MPRKPRPDRKTRENDCVLPRHEELLAAAMLAGVDRSHELGSDAEVRARSLWAAVFLSALANDAEGVIADGHDPVAYLRGKARVELDWARQHGASI